MLGRCLSVLLVALPLSGCSSTVEVRLHNATDRTFDQVRVAGTPYGPLAPGDTTAFREVRTRARYVEILFTSAGRTVSGQALNLGARRFTYRIRAVDMATGHMSIDVLRE